MGNKLYRNLIKFFNKKTGKKKGYSNGNKLRIFKLSQQAVFINSKNQVLLLKSTDGTWLLPGGRVDEGEFDLENAIKREIKEELNIENVEILQPIGVDQSNGKSTLAIAYFASSKELDKIKLSDEHLEFTWTDKEKLEEKMYYKNLARSIKKFIEEKKF